MIEFPSPSQADLEPVPLTPDQVADVKATVTRAQQALATIPFFLSNDGVSRFSAHGAISIAESELQKLGEVLGVATESAERIERRHGDIRRANMRVRELEALLGSQQSPQAVQASLKVLSRRLSGWWDLEGFGHVSDIAFGEYNLKATFSCGFFGVTPHVESTAAMTAKERMTLWLDSLPKRGFVLLDEPGEKGLLDCPETRQALRDLFHLRLPSARFSQFVSHESKAGSKLREVEIYIGDISEIAALPVPQGDADSAQQ